MMNGAGAETRRRLRLYVYLVCWDGCRLLALDLSCVVVKRRREGDAASMSLLPLLCSALRVR